MSEPFFSAEDIADLIELDESAMPDVFTIRDQDISDDGPTGETTRTTIGRLVPATGREAGADQVKALGSLRLYVPLTTAEIGATAAITDSTGKRYNVVYPFPVQGYSTSRIVGLEDA